MHGTPVFTIQGQYVAQGWTEWTQGFQFGSAIIQYDATGDSEFLDIGSQATVKQMASHVTHFGVHDHGFNNISTYGALRRLMFEGRLPFNQWELNFYEMALQRPVLQYKLIAGRRRSMAMALSSPFNGPHSLIL